LIIMVIKKGIHNTIILTIDSIKKLIVH
jgi:hypothetical protein